MKNNTLYSWSVIIALLIFFWPVGLYLLYKKAQNEKKTALTASKMLSILGTFFIVIGIITLMAIIGVFYLILGILLKRFANKLLNSAENVKKYLAIVINGNVRQLDSISAAVGKPYDVVKKELQKLIDDGYFRNAYINESTREIVIPEAAIHMNAGTTASARVVSCSCCGANNTVYGRTGECEYCGSPLS